MGDIRIDALWRYPVKSMRGEQLTDAPVDRGGVLGDRRYAVADAETGRVLSAKRTHRLLEARALGRPGGPVVVFPDGRALYAADADAALSEWLERPVRVVVADGDARPAIEGEQDGSVFLGRPGGFFDAAALHIVTTSTLAHLSELAPASAFDARRFRPNIVIDAQGARGPVERDWVGSLLHIGDVVLEVTKTCSRCALTTAPQDELPHDRDILRTVARHEDNVTGVYARVREPGMIEQGAAVRVVSRS